MKEFGTGHLLYFHALRWMALLFAGLFLALGAPQMAINARGRRGGAGRNGRPRGGLPTGAAARAGVGSPRPHAQATTPICPQVLCVL
jgi:hypothetical protein